jgi:hypothetical protein
MATYCIGDGYVFHIQDYIVSSQKTAKDEDLILYFFLQLKITGHTMLGGSLSPQHDESSGCG